MKKASYLRFLAVFFFAIAAVHAMRFFFAWEVQVNGWSVPRWVSLLAIVLGLWLTRASLRMAKR